MAEAPGLRAVSLDAAGTLLHPAEPIALTYARVATEHGHEVEEAGLYTRFRRAMKHGAPLRIAEPSWRSYWRGVVREAVGVEDDAVFDALYELYRLPGAWKVSSGADTFVARVRRAGMRLALISNWDDRLSGLLASMGIDGWFDEILVSGELGCEKPDPRIFEIACRRLGVAPAQALHVGDSLRADVEGARGAGLRAVHFGVDVRSFEGLGTLIFGDA